MLNTYNSEFDKKRSYSQIVIFTFFHSSETEIYRVYQEIDKNMDFFDATSLLEIDWAPF